MCDFFKEIYASAVNNGPLYLNWVEFLWELYIHLERWDDFKDYAIHSSPILLTPVGYNCSSQSPPFSAEEKSQQLYSLASWWWLWVLEMTGSDTYRAPSKDPDTASRDTINSSPHSSSFIELVLLLKVPENHLGPQWNVSYWLWRKSVQRG